MKIAIVSAIWKREALTEIFLQSLQRYRKDYGIPAMIAGSEGVKSRQMVEKSGSGYVEVKNVPLSGKFNKAAMLAMVNYKPDALMVLGSDDFVNDTLIQKYFISLKQGFDVIGFRDCYFYHTESKEIAYWKGYTNFRAGESIGMGRLISRKTWEKCRGKLWPSNMNSGLDYNMMRKIKKFPELKHKTMSVNDDNFVLVDIKGQDNITDFSCYRKDMLMLDKSTFNTLPEFPEIEKL